MTSQSDKARRFRELHQAPGAFVIPNPWDAGSARLLAGLGFQALATSSGASAGILGRRDGKVTREEALDQARAIVNATELPVSADLEKGFGDAPEAAAETIRLAAGVGLVGGSIEDASGDTTRPIYDLGHAVERVAAAVQAARALPFPFTLTARAEGQLRGRPELTARVFECHPEVSFWAMNDKTSIPEPKKARGSPFPPGIAFRRRLLVAHGFDPDLLQASVARECGAGLDDLIDACAAAWTAANIARGQAISFPNPPERDHFDLPIAIWV